MDINDYRRKIEQSVAKEQEAGPAREARAASEDLDRLILDKKVAAKRRAEALGRVTRAHGPDAVPREALDRLADPKESAVVRVAAIKLLQQNLFLSSIASEWRPVFVEALRAAVRDPAVRRPALDVLSLLKDRPTQELLLRGIRDSRRALVPLHEALRLLSTDVHADVIDVARRVVDNPKLRRNKAVSTQAVRILGADPASIDRLEQVVASDSYPLAARRMAATAVSHLSPERASAMTPAAAPRRGATRTPAAPARMNKELARHLETLRRVRQ